MSEPMPVTPAKAASGARRGALGQALSEYLVLVAFGLILLFVPWPMFGDRSVIGLMLDAFDIYVDSFHSVLSMPVP